MPFIIKPHLFKQFGNIEEASGFFLIVDCQYKGAFTIDKTSNNYLRSTIIYSNYTELEQIISKLPSFSHILIISPRFPSTLLSNEHKILCLGTTSTNMSFDDVLNTIHI
ncbi:hypothetical protein, partial [Coleofasciculus sp.]|uniref:hypothetical protein n=1 Tax=Coleofasciculus sp. TaxID=3100458 RepID=UPI003A1FF35B